MARFSILLVLLAFSACSTTPDRIAELENARALVASVDRDPMAERVAGSEVSKAKAALRRAEDEYSEGGEVSEIRQHAYLASRHAEIAQQRIAEANTRAAIEESESERARILLQAREQEAARATQRAEAQSRKAELSAAEAERQRQRAAEAIAAARELESELEDIRAEQTERGLVLTLGDVLFDTNQATLKPGAEKTITELAAFLTDRPERNLLIEGHTDSRGDDAYNRDLSLRRASAVRDALIGQGVERDRLRVVGLGEAYPVATNDTLAGRQQNRRVEIVVSDKDGTFAAASNRSPAGE